jgi:hypothetical protein
MDQSSIHRHGVNEMRIAQNDSALAHGAAKSMIEQMRLAQVADVRREFNRSNSLKGILRAFDKAIVYKSIQRPNGSRERWALAVLCPDVLTVDVTIIVKSPQSYHLATGNAAQFNRHALARVLQRSVGTTDVDLIEFLAPYARALMSHLPPVQLGSKDASGQIAIYSERGVFLGEKISGEVATFNTWVDRAQMFPNQIALSDRARDVADDGILIVSDISAV